jgi:hypothetical protein
VSAGFSVGSWYFWIVYVGLLDGNYPEVVIARCLDI